MKKLVPSSLAIFACVLMIIRNNIPQSTLSILIDIIASFLLIAIGKRVSGYF